MPRPKNVDANLPNLLLAVERIMQRRRVTREKRVRQILQRSQLDTETKGQVIGHFRRRKPKAFKAGYFHKRVLKWIRESGSGYCEGFLRDPHVVPAAEMLAGKVTSYFCRECNTNRARKRRKDKPEEMREYKRQYQRENPEVAKRAQKRWMEKNPGKAKIYALRWQKNNPEKVREIGRRKYEKLKTDPERYAAYLKKQREQYQRNKQKREGQA